MNILQKACKIPAARDFKSRCRAFMESLRAVLFGTDLENGGLIGKTIIYFLLITFAILYLEPIFYMISTSFKGYSDFTDPTTKWIPKDPTITNLKYAFKQMNIVPLFIKGKSLWSNLCGSTLFNSIVITFPAAIVQVFSCAIAGYAFGRTDFPFKKTMLVLLIFTFIIPPDTVFIPLTWIYKNFNLFNTPFCFIGPALFGHGLKGGLFVIIYMQFFRKIPKELEEAALIDGARPYGIFWKIMFPIAKPAKITVFLFSMVWHWNETYLSGLFYNKFTTLSVQIARVNLPVYQTDLNLQPVKMISGLIFILPIIIVYLFTQKLFTESVERTGLVE